MVGGNSLVHYIHGLGLSLGRVQSRPSTVFLASFEVEVVVREYIFFEGEADFLAYILSRDG